MRIRSPERCARPQKQKPRPRLSSDRGLNLVPRRRLELPHLAVHGPEPCASTNSAIWAGAGVTSCAVRRCQPALCVRSPVSPIPVLYRAPIDRHRWLEAGHIDHHHLVSLPVIAARKGFDAAGFAEQVVDGLAAEMIDREPVFTAFEREIGGRQRLHHPSEAPAARAVAVAQGIEISQGGVAHSATMTLAAIDLAFGHHMPSFVQIENKKRTNRFRSQVDSRFRPSTAAAALG
jgi:hypothetical protein